MALPRSLPTTRALDVFTVVLFLAAILSPAVDQLVREDSERGPTTELRQPAPRPATPTTWKEISAYPARYDAYFADSVGLRDVLLRWNSLEKLYLFDNAPSSVLFTGDDRWIFYTGEKSVTVYRGVQPFAPGELELWKRELELRRDALAAVGMRYTYALVPNKETVYPERMPTYLNRVGPTRREQFVEYMKANSTVDVLDMTDAFRAAKSQDGPGDYLYNQHGTHWAGRGSLVGYRTLLSHLAQAYPDLRPLPQESLEAREGDGLKDTWSKSMYIADVLRQRDVEFVPRDGYRHTLLPDRFESTFTRRTKLEGARGPSLVLFHDSFGPYVWDLLSEHFPRTCTRWGGYEAPLIAEEHPDVVVDMYVERVLIVTPPGPGGDAAAYAVTLGFEALPHRLFALDATSRNPFEGVGGAPIRVDAETGSNTFARHTMVQGARSPAITLPGTGKVVLRLDATAATPTSLWLYWKPADAAEFRRSDYMTFEVAGERAPRTVPLVLPAGATQFLLRPVAADVDVTVHAFELRSSSAP